MTDYTIQRQNMVKNQIISRDIIDPLVIESMLSVERHYFVRQGDKLKAYEDHPLSIGYGQTISQPYMVAIMTEKLYLGKEMSVLEIGTGSGYQTAVLSNIAKSVYTIEVIPELYKKADYILNDFLEYNNITMKIGDGSLGWIDYSQFDRIIVTAGGTKIPAPLVEQLKTGGIIIMPVGKDRTQILYQIQKTSKTAKYTKSKNSQLTKLGLTINSEYDFNIQLINYCMFVPLIGKYA